MAICWIPVPYALMLHSKVTMIPISSKLSIYIHTSFLLVRLHGTNKVGVTEVLETSWFVFCIQTCDQFHNVIKVTTQFSRWLPSVCCPPLRILLFSQCKPPIPIHQLTVTIESLRASVTLMATYLILLAIKPKPTNDITIHGGTTNNSFAIFTVRMLQKHFCVAFQRAPSCMVLLPNCVHWQYFIFHQL